MNLFTCSVQGHLDDFYLDVDVKLEACNFTVVWGPSGSGKTSLLRILAGLENRAVGNVFFQSEQWQSESSFVLPYERGVGFVFQSASLLPHLSVRQNLAYALKRSNSSLTIEEVANRFRMTTLLGKSVNQLSGGEAQRVALARAVLTNPRVILMDEPLASLDAKGKMEILNEIKRLSGFGVPIVYVTHSMEELLLLADRVLILNEGRNTFYGELPDAINHIFARHPEGVPPVSVLHMKVEGYDEPYSLQSVCSEEDVIYFTCSEPMADSSPVRVIVHGKDVVLFKNRPEGASALNMLRATISSVQSYDTGQVFVSLTTSAGDLRTLVTKKSYDHLQLSVGDSIWAVTKAVSILV